MMKKPIKSKDFEKLLSIKDKMLTMIDEAIKIIPEGIIQIRAKSSWYAQVKTAILKEHEFIGGSYVTLEDTINEVKYEWVTDEEEYEYEN